MLISRRTRTAILARMSSELGSSPLPPLAMRKFWRALVDVAVTAALAFLIGSTVGSMHGWFRWPTAVLALGMLMACHHKCCAAAEHLSEAKGVYHPMYGHLGPLGLVLAVFARRRTTPDQPTA